MGGASQTRWVPEYIAGGLPCTRREQHSLGFGAFDDKRGFRILVAGSRVATIIVAFAGYHDA